MASDHRGKGMNGHVIIVGGGISGTATAYELARNDVNVTLLERGELASMASGWTLAGVRQSGRHPSELPLAAAAVARWPEPRRRSWKRKPSTGNMATSGSRFPKPMSRRFGASSMRRPPPGISIAYLDSADDIHAIVPALTDQVLWRVVLSIRWSCQPDQNSPSVCRCGETTWGEHSNRSGSDWRHDRGWQRSPASKRATARLRPIS